MRSKLLLAGLLAAAVNSVHANPAQYQIATVDRTEVGLSVSIAGTVRALKTVQLTAQAPGRVLSIAGREGDQFATGNVLITLDDDALLARREAAYAAHESAYAAIQNAQAQASREYYSPRSDSSSNAPGGMGMPAMMDQMFANPMQNMLGMRDEDIERYSNMVGARAQLAQAQTALRQANANIKEIDAALRDTRSVAPFDGVIEKVYVEIGDTVQPGQPMVDYSETGQYKVEADLPIHLVRGLRLGQSLMINLDNKGQTVIGKMYRIYPTADLQRHTVRVELALPANIHPTAGQYVELQVPDTANQLPPQLTIPAGSVVSKGGMSLVFAVDPNGAARLRVVRLGETAGNGRVVVLSGVQQGDRVVDNPPPGLRAGTVVVPTAAPSAAPADAASTEHPEQ